MIQYADFLVIGSGIAGLSFALKASQLGEVVLITKKQDKDSNTNYAQGGIACVFSSDDNFDLHIKDTLITGAGLSKPEVVKTVVTEGPKVVQELIDWGVQFTKEAETGAYARGQEGGHSRRRILHAADLTGREVERALLKCLRETANVKIYEHQLAIDLIMEKQRCLGAWIYDTENKEIWACSGRIVLLATGGAGRIYAHTTNPPIATGDGIAMAYRAGAKIANMEFFQFHPTSFYNPEGETFLISEAVRGEGGILRTADGNTFMEKYHPQACLAPRDTVARAIDNEMKKSGQKCVYLHLSHLDPEFVHKRFPHISEKCREMNLDLARDPIPVVPAAHYSCGGVVTDLNGETSLKGLFATGEVACTGLHGANRLASNSLLEALVFSHRAFQYCKEHFSQYLKPNMGKIKEKKNKLTDEEFEAIRVFHCREELRKLMWDYVGIVRASERLHWAKERITIIQNEINDYINKHFLSPKMIELWDMIQVAELVVNSALQRKESRGLHYNIDYPKTDDINFKQDTILRLDKN